MARLPADNPNYRQGLTAALENDDLMDLLEEDTRSLHVRKAGYAGLNDQMIRDLKLLKAKLLLGGMSNAELYDYCGFPGGANSDTSKAGVVSKRWSQLRPVAAKWLEDHGFTIGDILREWAADLDATETKFFQHEGRVVETREVVNYQARQNALTNIGKIKGVYAAEKRELTGKDGEPLGVIVLPRRNQESKKQD